MDGARVARGIDVLALVWSSLLSDLLETGLITREIDPLDRRRARISLRVHLISKIVALAEARLRPLRAALIQIPTGDRVKFLEGWQILVASMANFFST